MFLFFFVSLIGMEIKNTKELQKNADPGATFEAHDDVELRGHQKARIMSSSGAKCRLLYGG